MNFAELLPSQQWSFLKFKGVTIAEVWFKPEGEPLGLVIRVRRNTFDIPGFGQRLSVLTLLKAVAIPQDQVESWRLGDATHLASNGHEADWANPLLPPPNDAPYLEVHIRIKPMPLPTAGEPINMPEADPAKWQDLEAAWKAVIGLEATVESSRKNVESARAELEASMRMTLSTEEKTNALAADVAQWNKAKNRAHYAVPKANEFIHRANWAGATPERKMLGELFKNPIDGQTSLPPADEIQKAIEILRKDRQVLSAQGVAVHQECKNLIADVQGALRRLQSNAATRASQKKGGIGMKGKSY